MRRLIFLFFICSLSARADFKARSKNFSYPSFIAASKADSFLRFDMESTLFGLLTARFPGYAKKFTLSWEEDLKNKVAKNLRIEIPVAFMDTDKTSRTDEMQKDSLEIKTNPVILVYIEKEIPLTSTETQYEASFVIRNKKFEKKIPFKISEQEGAWRVEGKFPLLLSESNIINPSKFGGVASFNDEVKLSYQFVIRK